MGSFELRSIPPSFAGADWKQNAVIGAARKAAPRSEIRREDERRPGMDTALKRSYFSASVETAADTKYSPVITGASVFASRGIARSHARALRFVGLGWLCATRTKSEAVARDRGTHGIRKDRPRARHCRTIPGRDSELRFRAGLSRLPYWSGQIAGGREARHPSPPF